MARLAVRFAILAVLGGLSWLVLSRLRYHWDWSAVWAYRSIFLDGLGLTLAVSVVAITLGLCFGLLSGLASVSGNLVLSELAAFCSVFCECDRTLSELRTSRLPVEQCLPSPISATWTLRLLSG